MLTVLMATHNGSATLARVLESYTQLADPPGGWRLVVIDNSSTDGVPEILRAFLSRLPLLALHTDRRGKNVALNAGLTHVEGDLVVFTDDDAVPDKRWLCELRRAADEQAPFDVFAGAIVPIWPDAVPEWIPRLVNLGVTYAVTPAQTPTGPVAAQQVWGPNMAVRAGIFRDGFRFDESVGPQAGQYMMGSEVEFVRRLEKNGHHAWFVAEAVVGHIVRPNQVDREWIIQRAFRFGRHMFQVEMETGAASTRLFRGAPLWRYRQFLSSHLASLAGAVAGGFDRKFLADWDVSFLRGYLSEAWRSTRQR